MCCIDDNTSPSGRHDAADTVAGQYNDSGYDDTPVSDSPLDVSLLRGEWLTSLFPEGRRFPENCVPLSIHVPVLSGRFKVKCDMITPFFLSD